MPDALDLVRSSWSEARDRRPWVALVRGAFHASYVGIGEAYQGVALVEEKIAAMSRYAADLTACTAFAGDELVGLLVGAADGTRLVIYDLFVAAAFRRRGIGRRLVEAAMSGTCVTVAAAEVNTENAASGALFESMGFRRSRSVDWFELRPAQAPGAPTGAGTSM